MENHTGPKLLPEGNLNPEWVKSLSGEAIGEWVVAVLRQQDPDFPPWAVAEPHDFLTEVYQEAPEGVRQVLRKVVTDCLLAMAGEQDSCWRADSRTGDSLLILAGDICGADIAPTVLRMARSGEFVSSGPTACSDLHARLLQLLMRLSFKESIEFWQAQARRDPRRYLPVAMRGAARSGLNPFQVLVGVVVPPDQALQADIRRVVDVLENELGSEWVRKWMLQVWSSVSATLRQLLDDVAPASAPGSQLTGRQRHSTAPKSWLWDLKPLGAKAA